MNQIEIVDKSFARYVMHNARLECIAQGFRWTEGPVWFGDAGCLLFSDIPNNRIMRWIEGIGVSVYRQPSQFANGGTRDQQGRLISCLHGARAVVRTEHDGRITTLVEKFQGQRLNSPNDVVVKSDGSIWFTDPHYGIAMDYEGERAEEELPCHVYRFDPRHRRLVVACDTFDCPNGLCFSPDESLLYIAETGRISEDSATREIRVFEIRDAARGQLGEGRSFYAPDVGAADGFRCDEDGNIWTSAGDGVHCVSPEGALLGRIRLGEPVSNVTFGGRHRSRLFICCATAVHAIYLNRRGAPPP
ncbi:SMP-30/gluconolactonase/LRE family protein [Lichenicoccus sp.]|uniref:SMP-30/gluconolactonase/LRE family protein n=1 Tax=Lichenicoccus sp. TaxID=2781899 RepID=UPI003D09C0C2